MPGIKKVETNDAIVKATSSLEQIQRIGAVVTQIINDSMFDLNGGLQEIYQRSQRSKNPMSKEEYVEQREQVQKVLNENEEALQTLSQQEQRLNQILKSETIFGFEIENTLTKDQLKNLLTTLEYLGSSARSKEEKLFFDTIAQTVTTLKNSIGTDLNFSNQIIPILDHERKYAQQLLILYNALNNHPECYQEITDMISISRTSSLDKNLSSDEKKLITNLCINLIKEYTDTSSDIPLQKRINNHLETTIQQSKQITITSGFRGFLNSICSAIGAEPYFTINSTSIRDKMKSMKSELKSMKAESPEPSISNDKGFDSPRI